MNNQISSKKLIREMGTDELHIKLKTIFDKYNISIDDRDHISLIYIMLEQLRYKYIPHRREKKCKSSN